MTETCRLCGHELNDQFVKIDGIIAKSSGWHSFAKDGAARTFADIGVVETISFSVVEGERHFGGDIKAEIIVLIDGLMYRKLGTTDSYGETTWDGALVQVLPKTQSIRAWERL